MAIIWKAKICSGMDVVEKIKFIKQGVDVNNKKITASAVYVPSEDEEFKLRSEWTDAQINVIADRLSDDLDESIILQGGM